LCAGTSGRADLTSDRPFGLTGSYQAAFVNGIVWNLVNVAIAVFLMSRVRRLAAHPPVPRTA
jgi:hypothetical protein